MTTSSHGEIAKSPWYHKITGQQLAFSSRNLAYSNRPKLAMTNYPLTFQNMQLTKFMQGLCRSQQQESRAQWHCLKSTRAHRRTSKKTFDCVAMTRTLISRERRRLERATSIDQSNRQSNTKSKPYPIPLRNWDMFNNEIYRQYKIEALRKLSANNITTQEWASPCFGVPKKDGSIRLVIDFGKLNNAFKQKE